MSDALTADEVVTGEGPTVHDPEPHVFVILGATGDLYRRKLLPAVYGLIQQFDIAESSVLLGAATSEMSDDEFRVMSREALSAAGLAGEACDAWCNKFLHYQTIGREVDTYETLKARIEELEAERGLSGNRVFYLALPPVAFPGVIGLLGEVGLNQSAGWTRLVVEKPFGKDLESAKTLNSVVHQHFDESQVYRIDHYLGKQTVQNLLVFRFANALFESAWNRDRIDNVQITVAEDLGIGTRAGYYETSGAMRDMVQNHLTQVLTLVAMEPPARFDDVAIRNEKVKVLRSISPIEPDDVVRGRYSAGTIGDEAVPGYMDEPDVAPDSTTETFVALRAKVDNWRWQGVPFYLRTGKRLPKRLTQVTVTFREPPVAMFEDFEMGERRSNVLIITLQPDERFELFFDMKSPSDVPRLVRVPLDFVYTDKFGPMPGAYQTLLHDVMTGDQTLFVRSDEVEESWRLFGPVLDPGVAPDEYPAGTWGPERANRLPDPDLDEWTLSQF